MSGIHPVHVPSPLRSYTEGAATTVAAGDTLVGLLQDLDARHRGLRFRIIDEQDRIWRHMRIFVNAREAQQLEVALQPGDVVHLVCALSGG